MNTRRPNLTRRYFLATAAAANRRAARAPSTRITRIAVAPIDSRFHEFVAMNTYDTAPTGHPYANHLVRIQTGEGVEGIHVVRQAGRRLLPFPPHVARRRSVAGVRNAIGTRYGARPAVLRHAPLLPVPGRRLVRPYGQ